MAQRCVMKPIRNAALGALVSSRTTKWHRSAFFCLAVRDETDRWHGLTKKNIQTEDWAKACRFLSICEVKVCRRLVCVAVWGHAFVAPLPTGTSFYVNVLFLSVLLPEYGNRKERHVHNALRSSSGGRPLSRGCVGRGGDGVLGCAARTLKHHCSSRGLLSRS